jgi:hypothetical protein
VGVTTVSSPADATGPEMADNPNTFSYTCMVAAQPPWRLRISLFAGAPQDEMERLPAGPGAGVLAVRAAGGRSAGAASGAGTRSPAGSPPGTGTPGVPAGLPARPEGDPDGAVLALLRAGEPGPAQTWLSVAAAA